MLIDVWTRLDVLTVSMFRRFAYRCVPYTRHCLIVIDFSVRARSTDNGRFEYRSVRVPVYVRLR